jgi:sensor histidine kinase YesM
MMTKSPVKQYFFIVFLISLAIALTIRFPMILSFFFENPGGHHPPGFSLGFSRLVIELGFTFIAAFLMFTMNFFILKPVEKHGDLKPLHVILAILLTIMAIFLINYLLFNVSRILEPGPVRRGHKSEFYLTNFFVSALVVGCVFLIRLIFQKQNYKLEVETLKREALQGQFESLKNQLSPHFLFNSLTALKNLIDEAPDKAQLYVNSLSKALRYTLQGNEKLVSVKEEMDFMESYLYLIRIRYETSLAIEIHIDNMRMGFMLPPLTIQTLVENAIKHNEISKRNPLRIEIYTTDRDTLCVANPIQKKMTEEEGTGIGLTNLNRQFELLIGQGILIRSDVDFVVEIPLIKP